MQTVQLAIADAVYAAALREALQRSGPWRVISAERPNPAAEGVLVLDEEGFNCLPLPISNPERVVLISRIDARLLSQAWEAGIVSVVSVDDPLNTVILAIMAAALRVPKSRAAAAIASGISPTRSGSSAPISPNMPSSGPKRLKSQ